MRIIPPHSYLYSKLTSLLYMHLVTVFTALVKGEALQQRSKWDQLAKSFIAQSATEEYSSPQSLKTPRRLENFNKWGRIPDVSYSQLLHLQNNSSQSNPRLEKENQSEVA